MSPLGNKFGFIKANNGTLTTKKHCTNAAHLCPVTCTKQNHEALHRFVSGSWPKATWRRFIKNNFCEARGCITQNISPHDNGECDDAHAQAWQTGASGGGVWP